MAKSIQEIREELLGDYVDRFPQLDLSEGTPERDIFIEAPISGGLISLWDNIDYLEKLSAPLQNSDVLNDDDVDLYCSSYGVTRRAATPASGIVTFYATTLPTEDVYIQTGTNVSTKSLPKLTFSVSEDLYVSLNKVSAYYNGTERRWEFSVAVEAVEASETYRAGAGTVTVIDNSIPGIQGCFNSSPIGGGGDAETSISMLERVPASFQSRGLNNDAGIKSFVENYSSNPVIVGAGDVLMVRDDGHGGCVDVYIKDTQMQSAQDQILITSTGLFDKFSGYTSSSITLLNQPVGEINSVIIDNIGISSEYYEFVSDESILYGSTLAKDKIVLTSTGISAIGYFTAGMNVEINYVYNNLLSSIRDNLVTPKNNYRGRNYLVRSQTPASISIALTLQPSTSIDDLQSSWNEVIASTLSSMTAGSTVSKSKILEAYNTITTILNIKIDSLVIEDVDGLGVVTSEGDVVLPKNVYPVFSSAIYTEWVI